MGPASFHAASAASVGLSVMSQIFVPFKVTWRRGPLKEIWIWFQSCFLRRLGNFSSAVSSQRTFPLMALGCTRWKNFSEQETEGTELEQGAASETKRARLLDANLFVLNR